ncbi:GGDEF domain-containing protein, partial [Aphanothece sacrum]
KYVNDTYGHDMGDIILITTVKVMGQCLRTTDCLGRYGGEEFLAILPETSVPGASDAAERIRQAIAAQSFPVENGILKITTSIGVTIYNSEDVKIDEVIKRADLAVYQAKNTGRNQVITLMNTTFNHHLSS